MKYMCHNL